MSKVKKVKRKVQKLEKSDYQNILMGLVQAFNVLETVQNDNKSLNLNRALSFIAAQLNDLFPKFTQEEIKQITELAMMEMYENVELKNETQQ